MEFKNAKLVKDILENPNNHIKVISSLVGKSPEEIVKHFDIFPTCPNLIENLCYIYVSNTPNGSMQEFVKNVIEYLNVLKEIGDTQWNINVRETLIELLYEDITEESKESIWYLVEYNEHAQINH